MHQHPTGLVRTALPCHGTRVRVGVNLIHAPGAFKRVCPRCGQAWALTLEPVGARSVRVRWERLGRPPADRWAGERARRRAKNGALYVLVDAQEAGVDAGGEWRAGAAWATGGTDPDHDPAWKPWRWATICDTHHTICGHPTLAIARSHLTGGEWCEACRDTEQPH